MIVLTFNIWNYQRNWPLRRALITSIIRDYQPDVVALQETRHDFRYAGGRGQAEQLADRTGYWPTWMPGQTYLRFPHVDEGLAVLTPAIPRRIVVRRLTRYRREPGDSNQRLCLGVVAEYGGREFHVYNTHFSLNPRVRVQNAREVAAFVRAEARDAPALIVGDLNAEPGETAIRYLTGAEAVDGETGDFRDCWPMVHGDDLGYTYASYDPVRRIDYVLARNAPDPVSIARVGGRSVNGVFASDHLGLLVTFPEP